MEALKARAEVTSLLKTVAEENGLKNHVIVDVKTNQKGEGYLGQIFMVTVKDPENGKQLNLVIKAAFIEQRIRDMVPIRASFQNEIYFYKNVLPAFQDFEKEHGMLEHVELVPKCLKVCVEDQAETLILQNLKSEGFETFDKKMVLDDDHVKLIFKTYGRFHAYSFALRDQKPEEYAKITQGFQNIYEQFMNNELFQKSTLEMSKSVQETFIPGEDDEIIKKYQKYEGQKSVDIFLDQVTKHVEHEAILHGDCWSNNMLFRYEDTADGRKPTEMRLIDFQIIKVGSPVCDLSYCLFSGASKKVFDNLNEYLQIYYDSFSSFLRKLGSDPEKLFPFSVLKEHWKKYSQFGMIMSFGIIKMKMIHKDDAIDLTDDFDMDNMAEVFANLRFDQESFNKRIRGLLWHMSEVGAL